MIEDWLDRFRQGERLALSRLLTFAARGEHVDAIRTALSAETQLLGSSAASAGCGTLSDRQARVLALTGNGGVGKSSLIGKLIELPQLQEKQVAIMACDPQSPLSNGALLGDRIRISQQRVNSNVYIRSLAVAAGQQAIAANLDVLIDLLSAFGFDAILLETVGAGQADTAVREVADVLVLLIQPEAGDELQWEKAGLLEVADIVVIHKSDLPGAERVESQVRELLNLPGCREVPVYRVSSTRNEGLSELWDVVESIKR